MSMITRTIVVSTAKVVGIATESGKVITKQLADYVHVDTKQLSKEQLLKLAKKVHPNVDIVIASVDYSESVMGITVEEFYNIAKEIERPESQKK